jgi:hypothetical protein
MCGVVVCESFSFLARDFGWLFQERVWGRIVGMGLRVELVLSATLTNLMLGCVM